MRGSAALLGGVSYELLCLPPSANGQAEGSNPGTGQKLFGRRRYDRWRGFILYTIQSEGFAWHVFLMAGGFFSCSRACGGQHTRVQIHTGTHSYLPDRQKGRSTADYICCYLLLTNQHTCCRRIFTPTQ